MGSGHALQADRDLVVIAGAQGSVLDPSTTVGQEFGENSAPPSHVQGISAKMGLDATKPVVYHEHVFTKVRVPGEDAVSCRMTRHGHRSPSVCGPA